VKRFLCGVEGVKEAGSDVLVTLLGGVCDRVGSFIVVECDEGNKVVSGERLGGVACGIVVSKISERSNVENVRFASSAAKMVSCCQHMEAVGLTFLKVKFAMWRTLLWFTRSCW
jgi:hypothetical protein